MNRKVWHIGEQEWDWKSPPGKKDSGADRPAVEVREEPRGNPAWSYSLSLLLWGSGHMYFGRKRVGALLLAAMLVFSAAVGGLVVCRDQIHGWFQAPVMPPVVLLAGTFAAVLLPLTLAMANASHAYFRTAAGYLKPWRGVDNVLWPLIASSLFPGWGQFLNAQPKKGLFFGLFSVLGSSSLATLALFWHYRKPFLHETTDMVALETVLLILIIVAAAAFLMWLVALHDVVVTCRQPYRRRPPSKNVLDASRRVGMKRVWALLPDLRGALLLFLLLAAVLLAAKLYTPWDDARRVADVLRLAMLDSRMEIIPELLGRAMRPLP